MPALSVASWGDYIFDTIRDVLDNKSSCRRQFDNLESQGNGAARSFDESRGDIKRIE